MRFLSVCSGIEAASQAWYPLGWEAVAFAEVEPFPCAVLAQRYPGAPNLGDITKHETWPDLTIDALVGGTPCQGFSIAGERGGMDDPRSRLVHSFSGIAARYLPRWLIWENVPGVLSSGEGRDFPAFLGELVRIGYHCAWRVLDAQYFGVPQRRRRVFVVGYLGDWRPAAAVLFERHSLQGHPAPSRKAREGLTHELAPSLTGSGRGVPRPGDSRGQDPVIAVNGNGAVGSISSKWAKGTAGPSGDECQSLVAGTLASNGKAAGSATQQDAESGMLIAQPLTGAPYSDRGCGDGTLVTHALTGEGFDASEDGTGRGVPPVTAFHGAQDPDVSGDVTHPVGRNHGLETCIAFNLRGREEGAQPEEADAASVRASTGGSSNSYVAFSGRSRGDDGRGYERGPLAMTDGVGALDTVKPWNVAGRSGVRRLTPRECERLQGFPDDYTLITFRGKPACDGPRYKALGNSMAVPVMAFIGRRIAMVNALLK